MCAPVAAAAAVSAVTTAAATINNTIQERKNAKYDAQIAYANAKNAASEAKKQEQTGIELSREEKIKGLRNAKQIYAQNASGGFDTNSTTSFYNFQDVYNEAQNSAYGILNTYNDKASNYYTKADRYMNQRQNIVSKYNAKLFNNALGLTNKVASSWGSFNKGSNGGANDFF